MPMYCAKCGKLNDDATTFCKSCGSQIAPAGGASQVIVAREEKSPAIALILSFLFAGLGQIYNDEMKKGVWIIILHAISIGLIVLVIGLITTPAIWIWSMVDAYKTAAKINHRTLSQNTLQAI